MFGAEKHEWLYCELDDALDEGCRGPHQRWFSLYVLTVCCEVCNHVNGAKVDPRASIVRHA